MVSLLNIQDAYNLAYIKDGYCIDTEWNGPGHKYKWMCNIGHTWFASFYNIKRKTWCPICSAKIANHKRSLSKNDYYSFAKLKGGRCLFVGNGINDKSSLWECKEKHTWNTSFNCIKNCKTWCPKCAIKNRAEKHRLKDVNYHNVAEKNNGKCLFIGSGSGDNSAIWQCDKNHTWNSCYDNVKQGYWCPYCAGNRHKTEDDYHTLAKKYNGKCLFVGKSVDDNSTKWQCEKGHIWAASYSPIRKGHWCPKCWIGKSQNLVYHIIQELFPTFKVEQDFFNFPWLKTNKKKKQHIDIYIPELKLAIEYDGKQHFKPVRFGGISEERAIKNLKIAKRLDRRKTKVINKHPEDVKYFIRIKYTEELTKENIIDRLKQAGVAI